MAAGKKNLIIEAKSTFRKKLVYKDARKRPVNLAGFGARMQVRLKHTDDEVLLDMTVSNGRMIVRQAGVIELYLSADETAALTWSAGVYDLKLFAPNGDEIRLLEGKITVSPGVTE